LQQIFIHLRQLGARLRDRAEWETVSRSFQVIGFSESPFISAYALYISCVSLRRYAGRSHCDDFETAHQVVLSALAQSENLCNRVWPMNMTDLIRNRIRDEFQYARAGQSFSICGQCLIDDFLLGLVIVQSFQELNKYADSMIVLQPSQKKDGTGPLTVCPSPPLTMELVYSFFRSRLFVL
jgi:hypothetical protein